MTSESTIARIEAILDTKAAQLEGLKESLRNMRLRLQRLQEDKKDLEAMITRRIEIIKDLEGAIRAYKKQIDEQIMNDNHGIYYV